MSFSFTLESFAAKYVVKRSETRISCYIEQMSRALDQVLEEWPWWWGHTSLDASNLSRLSASSYIHDFLAHPVHRWSRDRHGLHACIKCNAAVIVFPVQLIVYLWFRSLVDLAIHRLKMLSWASRQPWYWLTVYFPSNTVMAIIRLTCSLTIDWKQNSMKVVFVIQKTILFVIQQRMHMLTHF